MMIYYLQLFFETHFIHIRVSATGKLINDFPSTILLLVYFHIYLVNLVLLQGITRKMLNIANIETLNRKKFIRGFARLSQKFAERASVCSILRLYHYHQHCIDQKRELSLPILRYSKITPSKKGYATSNYLAVTQMTPQSETCIHYLLASIIT